MDDLTPTLTLADARHRTNEIHLAARLGQPIVGVRTGKQLAKQEKTLEELEQERQDVASRERSFSLISEAWLKLHRPTVADSTGSKATLIIRDYLQPATGNTVMATLGRKDAAPTIREMAAKTPSLARTVPRYINILVEHCIDEEIRPEHTELNFHSVTRKIGKPGKLPAALDEEQLGKLIRVVHKLGQRRLLRSNNLHSSTRKSAKLSIAASVRTEIRSLLFIFTMAIAEKPEKVCSRTN